MVFWLVSLLMFDVVIDILLELPWLNFGLWLYLEKQYLIKSEF